MVNNNNNKCCSCYGCCYQMWSKSGYQTPNMEEEPPNVEPMPQEKVSNNIPWSEWSSQSSYTEFHHPAYMDPWKSRTIQLWEFLLEMLMDETCQDFISWTGDGWEFEITNPREVSRRWGKLRNRPTMNYQKLSRALRYYYDKNIISKTPGKQFVYRFVV